MIVAGEASGDKHAASLVHALKRLYPQTNFECFGIGGYEMRGAGVETLIDSRRLAVIGVPEIAMALGRLYHAYRTVLSAMRSRRPDVVVLVDWPDFNLRIAKRSRDNGFRTVYYISPQVWAWKKYRLKTIRNNVDRMLVILPFEQEFYRQEGIEVHYVGHPLAGTVQVTESRELFFERHGLDPARDLIALLPGSREKEIHYNLPPMLEAARLLAAHPELSGAQFIIPVASTVGRGQIESIVEGSGVPVVLAEREAYCSLGHSRAAVVASGTATVEAALLDTPMVVIYRGSELNWRLIRPLINIDTFAMVNLIAGDKVVPELIQHDVTGERIARELLDVVAKPDRLAQMKKDLMRVRQLLGAGGLTASENAAEIVMQEVSAVGSTS